MPISIIPAPRSVRTSDADPFVIDGTVSILADEASRPALTAFLELLRDSTGFPLPVVEEQVPGPVMEFSVTEGADHPERYRIEVTGAGVEVVAASAHGIFNATQTRRQLLPAAVEVREASAFWQLPAGGIDDWPEFDYRGLMIDVAGSFLTLDEMKLIIDMAVRVKISHLHLHLTDDQGWRIEITNEGRAPGDTIDYTRLAAVSGRTAMTERGYGGEPGCSGYYTQAEFRELVRYAAARYVTVVPAIDLPGHTIGALAAVPELNTAGSSHPATAAEPVCPPDGTVEVGHSYLDPDSDHTYTFARHVLGQLARLTPGEFLHIGGDEPLKMTEHHGHDAYLDCVRRLVEIVRDVGKRPLGWNEVAEAAPGPDMMIQYWQGESAHTLLAAAQGARVILSRGESSYLDQKYHPDFPIGLEWACQGDCDFPLHYTWEPRELIPGLHREQIVGVEGSLWSETVRGFGQVLLMAFPRLFAIAELGWSDPASRDLGGFTDRVACLAPRLLLSGGNFYDGEKAQWRPAVAGVAAPLRGEWVRLARAAAPGAAPLDVRVTIEGREVRARVETVVERGPLQAGPVVDVWVAARDVREGQWARVDVGPTGVAIPITSGKE